MSEVGALVRAFRFSDDWFGDDLQEQGIGNTSLSTQPKGVQAKCRRWGNTKFNVGPIVRLIFLLPIACNLGFALLFLLKILYLFDGGGEFLILKPNGIGAL